MCWLFCRLVGSALANAQRSLAAGHALVRPDFTCPRSVTWNALLRRAGARSPQVDQGREQGARTKVVLDESTAARMGLMTLFTLRFWRCRRLCVLRTLF